MRTKRKQLKAGEIRKQGNSRQSSTVLGQQLIKRPSLLAQIYSEVVFISIDSESSIVFAAPQTFSFFPRSDLHLRLLGLVKLNTRRLDH